MSVSTGIEEKLAALICARDSVARDVQITDLRPLSGGNARRAYSFDAAWRDGQGVRQERCVLLCRAEAGQLEVVPRHEFDVLRAIEGRNVAAPRALWFDEDGEWLGVPGVVLTRAEGQADITGLLKRDSTISRSLALQLVEQAARLHALDVGNIGMIPAGHDSSLDIAIGQLQHWQAQFRRKRLEPLPALEHVFHWLLQTRPATQRAVVVHGDFRFGNFLHQEDRLITVLDWELAHVGDPAEDLAWCYRPLWSPEHFLTLEEALEHYRAAGGPDISLRHIAWWRIFGEARFAVISLNAVRSYMDAGTENLRLAGRASKAAESMLLALQWIDRREEC